VSAKWREIAVGIKEMCVGIVGFEFNGALKLLLGGPIE
jgi:hypothetical protein